MAERETRSERRKRTASTPPRGRKRWYINVGIALLAAVGVIGGGVGYYHFDQKTPYSISSVEGIPLVQKALEQEGVKFDPEEKELWVNVEREKVKLPTDTLQIAVDSRLNLLRNTMLSSKVPVFKSTAEHIDELIREGILYPRILTNAPRHSTRATTKAEISEGKLILSLNVSARNIQEDPLWASAIDFVHEHKHIKDFMAFDSGNQNLTDEQRGEALNNLMGTTRKNLAVEAPAYAAGVDAFLKLSALKGLDLKDILFLPMSAHYIRANRDFSNPKFQAYLVKIGLVQ